MNKVNFEGKSGLNTDNLQSYQEEFQNLQSGFLKWQEEMKVCQSRFIELQEKIKAMGLKTSKVLMNFKLEK